MEISTGIDNASSKVTAKFQNKLCVLRCGGQHDEIVKKLAELAGIDPSLPNLSMRVSNTTFSSPEFNRLRGEKVRLQSFQESWIPIIKNGGFSRFALYDLESDPRQEKDISKLRPGSNDRCCWI